MAQKYTSITAEHAAVVSVSFQSSQMGLTIGVHPRSQRATQAEHSRIALHDLFRQRLAEDDDLERRLRIVEDRMKLLATDTSSSKAPTSGADDDTIIPIHGHRSTLALRSISSLGRLTTRSFETSLASSWVYRRVQHREEDMSFNSSTVRRSAWSALSDMSLADFSVLSFVGLPVMVSELYNAQWYTGLSPEIALELTGRSPVPGYVSINRSADQTRAARIEANGTCGVIGNGSDPREPGLQSHLHDQRAGNRSPPSMANSDRTRAHVWTREKESDRMSSPVSQAPNDPDEGTLTYDVGISCVVSLTFVALGYLEF
jgi:hypothetical protein